MVAAQGSVVGRRFSSLARFDGHTKVQWLGEPRKGSAAALRFSGRTKVQWPRRGSVAAQRFGGHAKVLCHIQVRRQRGGEGSKG